MTLKITITRRYDNESEEGKIEKGEIKDRCLRSWKNSEKKGKRSEIEIVFLVSSRKFDYSIFLHTPA